MTERQKGTVRQSDGETERDGEKVREIERDGQTESDREIEWDGETESDRVIEGRERQKAQTQKVRKKVIRFTIFSDRNMYCKRPQPTQLHSLTIFSYATCDISGSHSGVIQGC